MSSRELYIDEQLVDLSEDTTIALTSQINDIGNPETRNGNYSNKFNVPMTANNNKIFGFSVNVQSSSKKPYRKLSAKYIDAGVETVPVGFAIIEQSSQFYEITVYSGNSDFFALIDGKNLRELDMSDLNHAWIIANITASRLNTEGYIYPIIDYGNLSTISRSINVEEMFPAMFVKTIIERIVEQQIGWTAEGDILTDDSYIKKIIPLSSGAFEDNLSIETDETTMLTSPSQDFQYNVNQWDNFVPAGGLLYGEALDGVVVDFGGGLTAPFIEIEDGTNFSGNEYFLAPKTGRIKMTFAFKLKLNIQSVGSIAPFGRTVLFPSLLVYNNSTANGYHEVALQKFPDDVTYLNSTNGILDSYTGGTDNLVDYETTFTMTIETDVHSGDEIRFAFYMQYALLTGGVEKLVHIDLESFDLIVAYQPQIVYGQTIDMASVLPDMSQKDFMKGIFNIYGIMPDAQGWNRTLKLRHFDDLNKNISKAKIWGDGKNGTQEVFTNQPEVIKYRVGNYGQNNNCLYIRDGLPTQRFIQKELGNSSFAIDDETLPISVDAITLPFASTDMSKKFKWSLDVPVINKVDSSGNITGNVSCRILTMSPANNVLHIPPGIFESGGICYVYDKFNSGVIDRDNPHFTGQVDELFTHIPTCYFIQEGMPHNLGFETLLPKYYQQFLDTMKDFKMIIAELKLEPKDVQNFDHLIPVYSTKHQLYFYVNKIGNFINERLTSCELVKL